MNSDETTRIPQRKPRRSETLPESIGKYRVDEIIGKGGFGIVYKGFDPNICRAVAIKSLRSEILAEFDDQPALLARFAAEARSAGRCQHPNIVTVFDYVEQDEAPFIVMEYVPAGTLQNVTRARTLLPLPQIAGMMSQLLSALGHAHDNGVVHRDIKPANILCPTATVIKVTDFGIARLENFGLTRDGGAAIGTPGYMSPEQVLGREVDNRSDLFAAGVILYQLLTGNKPFTADNLPSLIHKLLHEPPAPVCDVRTDLPKPLGSVVERALAQQPKDRFQTAADFATAIDLALKDADIDDTESIDVTNLVTVIEGEPKDGSSGDLGLTMSERISADTLHKLEESLARSIGPIARVLLAREARESSDPDKLIEALGRQIPSQAEAERFRKSAEACLKGDRSVTIAAVGVVISEADRHEAAELLKPIIGPVARILVDRTATTAINPDEFYRSLAEKISEDAEREKFLSAFKSRMQNPGT